MAASLIHNRQQKHTRSASIEHLATMLRSEALLCCVYVI